MDGDWRCDLLDKQGSSLMPLIEDQIEDFSAFARQIIPQLAWRHMAVARRELKEQGTTVFPLYSNSLVSFFESNLRAGEIRVSANGITWKTSRSSLKANWNQVHLLDERKGYLKFRSVEGDRSAKMFDVGNLLVLLKLAADCRGESCSKDIEAIVGGL